MTTLLSTIFALLVGGALGLVFCVVFHLAVAEREERRRRPISNLDMSKIDLPDGTPISCLKDSTGHAWNAKKGHEPTMRRK